MKKLYIIAASILLFFSLSSTAQNPPACYAAFQLTVSNTTAQFYAAGAPDSTVTHLWYFGDGANSNLMNPTHTYNVCGVYTVYHEVRRNDANGGLICRDSAFQVITIACNTPCNVSAAFTASSVNNQPNVFEFVNHSVVSPNTFVTCLWNFGDGYQATSSTLANQVHTYAVAGVYNVCLIVTSGQTGTTNICRDTFCLSVQSQTPTPTPCNLQASFTYMNSGYTYSFSNTSAGYSPGDTIRWIFSSGTITNVQNPTITFPGAGTYSVCLRVKKATVPGTTPCVSETCDSIIVSPLPCNIVPAFAWNQATNTAPYAVAFTNQSAPANTQVAVSWTFGDGSSGTGYNVTHSYAQAGTYTVCMSVNTGNGCVRDTCRTITVSGTTPTPCNLVANFTVSSVSGNTVAFVNTSTGFAPGDSIRWNFGDGSFGYDVNPTHTYAQAGTYNVCLRIVRINAAGTPCVSEMCHQVTIAGTSPCNVHASFTTTSSNNIGQFVNTSTTGNTSATGTYSIWNFGDGTPALNSPGLLNQVHTYLQPGTYTVCLQVISVQPGTNITCIDSSCSVVIINSIPPAPCNIHPMFTVSTAPNNPNEFVFVNTTQTSSAQMMTTWHFGDSSVATGNVATHVFAQPGTYSVCMQVAISNTCSADTCITVTVNGTPNPPPCNLVANFSWQNSPASPNVIYFLNSSSGMIPGDSIRWTFGDGSISNMMNPAHTFNSSGTYNVCLRIARAQDSITGAPVCVSEICHPVIVPPVLVAYPNPATSIVNVNVTLNNSGPIYAFLYNSQNMLIAQQIVTGLSGSNTITFNTQNLAPGYYTIRLYYDGHFSVARFLKL